ncbi:MAG: DMT family transporter [Alphaproteobacteria bacterium]|nr:DMT family transporter [Alphaproteobacteria bacterium]
MTKTPDMRAGPQAGPAAEPPAVPQGGSSTAPGAGPVRALLASDAAKGILFKLAATLAFTLMNVIVKALAALPTGELVFARAFFAIPPLVVVAWASGGLRRLVVTRRPLLHVRRSLTGTLAIFCYFVSLTALPLVDATAISFVMPIFSVVLAALVLKEQVGVWRWGAVVAGFLGVLLILAPHLGEGTGDAGAPVALGAAAGLFGSFLAAFVVIFIRSMSTTETSESIVFYFMATAAALSALSFFFEFEMPTAAQAGLLVLCGVLGGLAQLAMTYSYRFAEPSLLAPFDYAAIVWATLLGIAIFAEVPTPIVCLGMLVIVAAGLTIAWRERHRHIERPKPPAL